MNHQNKIKIFKNLFFSNLKVFKTSFFVFIAAALIVGGFFTPGNALATGGVTITPASGGTNISIDTTSAGGSNTFTELSGPGITEQVAGDIAVGTHTISLPAGWEFDTTSMITVFKIGNIGLASTNITPVATSFEFTVTSVSTNVSILGFNGIKVKPTGITPSSGSMIYSGAGINGVNGNTNFGTLSTVAGTVTKLAFTTEPGGAVYGSFLNPQPVVKTQDQFGNNSTSGLVATEMVSLSLTGTGVLQGTVLLNIGTSGDTPGTVTFADLKVGDVGAIGTKGLTASATGLTSAVSGNFEITPKPLIATVTVGDKPYDGNNSAVITGVTLDGVETGDNVTVDNQGVATFADPNADADIVVTSNGVTITGAHAGNYSFGGTATGAADITPLEIMITPTAGQTKIYGQDDPDFTYTNTPDLIVGDIFSGALSRVAGEDVGIYAYTIGTLENGLNNYALTLVPNTFEITQKPLTVTATGINKEYDQTTDATVTLSSADEVPGDNLVYSYTNASFLTKTAENGKTVNVSGISISGAKAGNYALQNTTAQTTADITKKPITATLNINNKTYNGNTNAVYSSTNPRVANGVIADDIVVVENTGTKAFVDKHVGVGKTVNAVGLTLSGADADNYAFDGTGTGTATINVRGITVTAAIDNRIYDSTTGSAEIPTITSGALQGTDTAGFIQTYDNKNVGTGKTLTPSGVVIDGNPILEGSNYAVTFEAVSTGVITEKSINVTAQPDTKIYDGTTSSDEVPIVDPLEIGDTVSAPPIQTYDTKDVGITKTLTPGGLVINDGNNGLNYNIVPVTANGVINQKALTVSGATTDSKTYDGLLNATVDFTSAGLVGVVPGEEALVSLDSTGYSAIFDNKNVGIGKTVTISGLALSGAGASHYSLTQPILNDGVITERAITVTATGNTKTYDGLTTAAAIPTITAGSLASGDTETFAETYDNANVGATHILTPAGTIADAGGTDMTGNYDITFTPIATGVIEKALLTITADDQSREYGDANPALTASYSGFVNSEDESVLDTPVFLSTTADATSPVGDYPIIASGAVDTNYEITHNNGILTVNPAPIVITPNEGQGKIYGNSDQEITYTADGFKNSESESIFTGALDREEGENADEYSITEGTLDVGGNYFIDSFFDVFYTIEPRPLTITAVTDSKIYDGNTTSNETPTITGELQLQFGDAPAFTQSYDAENVGTSKTLTPEGIVNDGNNGDNYIVNFVNNETGIISTLEITVTPNAGQSKVYGENDPVSFLYTNVPSLIGDDEFSGALDRNTGENAGFYTYTLGNLSAGSNYLLTLGGTETFEIVKATPVITWANPADIVYGTALSGTELNAIANVGGAFVYTPAEGTLLNAGIGQTLSTAFTPTDTLNYNDANKDVLIIVLPAPLTITADDKSKEYGVANPILTATYSGFVNDETASVLDTPVSLSTTANDTSPAGNYDIVASGAVDANYSISYVSGTLTITDTVAPTVVSHTPLFNAINVSPATAIVITFSEPVIVEGGDVSFNPIISGGFAITNSGTSVVTITPNNLLADNTTYTITLDGVKDINGLSLLTYSNIKFTTATNYSINLNANASGWNLISLPVVPSNTAIATVLGSAADNINAVWTYDPTNLNAVDGWLVYNGNSGTSNLNTMTSGYGYWISVANDTNFSGSGTLLAAGPTLPPSRSLQTGWNLIGYYQLPNETNSNPASAFASIGASGVGYNGLWGFDNTIGLFKQVTTILPGDAFWISLPSEKIYSPSNL